MCEVLSTQDGSRLIDKTGIQGMFDIGLDLVLGLKIESARGPGEYLVIDHIERPSEN